MSSSQPLQDTLFRALLKACASSKFLGILVSINKGLRGRTTPSTATLPSPNSFFANPGGAGELAVISHSQANRTTTRKENRKLGPERGQGMLCVAQGVGKMC